MLIRNVKSFSDLQKKRELQANLLQIAIENEEMLENRVKDYKNPNKPPPVPPQFKTTAEIQQDTNLQQKEVINNLLSISGVDISFEYCAISLVYIAMMSFLLPSISMSVLNDPLVAL